MQGRFVSMLKLSVTEEDQCGREPDSPYERLLKSDITERHKAAGKLNMLLRNNS